MTVADTFTAYYVPTGDPERAGNPHTCILDDSVPCLACAVIAALGEDRRREAIDIAAAIMDSVQLDSDPRGRYNVARHDLAGEVLAQVKQLIRDWFPGAVELKVRGEYGDEFGADDRLRAQSITIDDGAVMDENDSRWEEFEEKANDLLDELIDLTGDDYLGDHTIELDPGTPTFSVFDTPDGWDGSRPLQ